MSSPETWHLAEANVARLRAPLDDPTMAGLVRALDDVNWLAERSPGFVWRHRPEQGQASARAIGRVVCAKHRRVEHPCRSRAERGPGQLVLRVGVEDD